MSEMSSVICYCSTPYRCDLPTFSAYTTRRPAETPQLSLTFPMLSTLGAPQTSKLPLPFSTHPRCWTHVCPLSPRGNMARTLDLTLSAAFCAFCPADATFADALSTAAPVSSPSSLAASSLSLISSSIVRIAFRSSGEGMRSTTSDCC